ncbi:MAG: 3-phosphoglycerate dehydrogenase [Treponema sp.]|nr:3-phosphoglycerate dehydrogenase [Treponema sp.]
MYKIQTLNKIASVGLNLFPHDDYEIASSITNPDAILVRSFDMHECEFSKTLKAVARAGAGTNNIPVAKLTEKGVVVFNTPGANANAVKELVLLALLLSNRKALAAAEWLKTLSGKGDEIPELAEKGKSQFVGPELKGKTLGVIGLGAIGAMVANAAVDLGMRVIGYDPFISVKSAWHLNTNVLQAETLDSLLAKSDYVTIHMPQTDETKGFINADKIAEMKNGVRVINFARGGLVNNIDMLSALESGKISMFITDFASEEFINHPKIICFPHLGASTPEAEENCAIMAVEQIRAFLEKGIIENSVNFPRVATDNPIPKNGMRLCIANRNVPGIVSKFTTILGESKLNIAGMINQNRGDVAYNIIDIDNLIAGATLTKLVLIENVMLVRPIIGYKQA